LTSPALPRIPIPHRIRTIQVPVFAKEDVFYVAISKAEARRLLDLGVFDLIDNGNGWASIEAKGQNS